MSTPGSPDRSPLPATALIACDVLEKEVKQFAQGLQHLVLMRFFEMGLHDTPDKLRKLLQGAIDDCEADPQVEAIALVYGLCGTALAGLKTRRCPLIVPRAHDCITLFMGSKERYAAYKKSCPGAYFYTPGWNRRRRVPCPEKYAELRAQYAERFDEEEAEFLVQSELDALKHNDRATYLDLGVGDTVAESSFTARCAAWLGWKFDPQQGDPGLLKALLEGRWTNPEQFLIVQPSKTIGVSADDAIIRAE